MGLKVWLPLNGTLDNQGTSNPSISLTSGNTWASSGKIGSSSLTLTKLQTILPTSSCMTGAKEISYSYWVKVNTAWSANWLDGIRWIETNGSATSTARQEFYTNCTLIGTWYKGGAISGKAFTPGVWTHLAATINYNTGEAKFYINGVLSGSRTNVDTTYYCRGDFYIGDNGTDICENDVRIYDHCLSAVEVREISQGLVLHYKLDGTDTPNENLGNTSADYHNFSDGYTKAAGSWGGDAGTVTFHHSGGYAGLPYKELHKTATGTGGIYSKTADDIVLEANTTYTMSCWIKSSRNFRPIHYSFNINRGVGNVYITYGSSFDLTTEWQFFSKTFTTTEDQAGSYGEMSIIYDDDVTDYYIYYSGFKIEKGTIATRWTPPGIQYTTIQDSSGYNHNGTILNTVSISSDTPRYSYSTKLEAGNSMINCGRGGMMTDSITVNMWIKSSAWANPVSCTEGGGWNFEASGDYFRFPVYVSGVGYKYGQSSTTKAQICNNQWHMLTGIYDRINQKIQIYVDGQLDNDYATGTSNNIGYHGSNCIWIGAEATGSNIIASNGMAGLFSDFRIYATALNADAIRQLYEVGAKVDNKQNLHAFEFAELNSGRELLAVPLTQPFSNHTAIYSGYDNNGEITLTGRSSVGSGYIKINPTGHTYYYDIDVSTDSGNVFYIGFEKYDINKTARSNNACVYLSGLAGSSEARTHKHYHGTVNLATDGVNPTDTIALRILNDWSGANGRKATIHRISLREVSSLQNSKINKKGQVITDELIELDGNCRIQKNGTIEANEIIEL